MNHKQKEFIYTIDEAIAPIIEYINKYYCCNIIPFSSCENENEKAYIKCIVLNYDKFQEFIHIAFPKIIDKIEVINDGKVTTITWNSKLTNIVINSLSLDDGMKTIEI